MSALSSKKRIETIYYLDALGRTCQTITVNGSPLGKDVVAAVKYDGSGRQDIRYMPFASSNTNGVFITDPVTACINYYDGTVPGRESGDYPYYQTMFEISPLNRVIEERGPDAWKTHPSQVSYSTNATPVTHWKTNKSAFSIPANQLFVTQYLDADQHKTREYKNKLGQVIQKSVCNDSTWLNTSFVYDDHGLLSIVVPPKATGAADTELCYYYAFDNRKRMTMKHLPGAQPVFMAYDTRDRLVMVQDGNLDDEDKWLATLYDALNRPVMTAYTGAGKTVEDVVTDFGNVPVNASFSTSGSYFDYNVSLPSGYSISENSIQFATFYDTYNFIPDFGSGYDYGSYTCPSGYPASYSSQTTGLTTGTITRVLDNQVDNISDDLLLSVMYYDDKGRVLLVVSDNHLGGKDLQYTQYNYANQVTQTFYRHNAYGSSEDVKIITDYLYDDQGRLLSEKVTVNSQPAISLAYYAYNELGEVILKKLHGDASGNNFNQQLDYTYNIKGWLRKINNTASLNTDLFALELRYNTPATSDALTSAACFNGNISEMLWNNNGSPKGYGFTYDGANRLTFADYADGSSYSGNQNKYNTSYGYDDNGNFSSLTRYLNGTLIDNLEYSYINSGNRLSGVQDNSNNAQGYDDNNGNYTYDANGNMTYDPGKGVNITYNELNLPEQVQFGANDNIRYVYDASGHKCAKVVDGLNAANNSRSDYCGNFMYEDNRLKAIFTSQGRIVPDSVLYLFEYNLKDHLGNTRVSFIGQSSGTPLVTQRSSYFPFGMVAEQTNSYTSGILENKYLYNSKELQDDEIAGVKLNWYDYGARFYDPQIGRWHVIDPAAEKFSWASPYSFCFNNPINSIDPDGREPITLSILVARAAIGAAIGAGIDITVQMTANMTLGNQGFWDAASSIDWTSVGASAVTGAVGVPGANVISKTAKVATIATAVTFDAAVDISVAEGNQNIFNGEKSLSTATIDAAGSLIGGKASDDIVRGAKNSISKDISSGTYSTLNKAEKSTLRQTQAIVNSQGFEAGTNTVVKLGAEAGKQGAKSVVGTGSVPNSVVLTQIQNYIQPMDNTRVVHPVYPLR